MKEFDLLELDFNESKNKFNQFLEITEEQTSQKVFSKGFLFNLRDFEKESLGFKKGKQLNVLPKKLNDVFVYYFDAKGKIIIVDTYGSTPNIIDKEFCFYEPGGLKTYYFSGGMIRLRNITFSQNEESKTKLVLNYGIYGVSVKEYVYNSQSVLEKIVVKAKQHNKSEFESHELLFTFQDNVVKKVVQSFPNGYQKDIFK